MNQDPVLVVFDYLKTVESIPELTASIVTAWGSVHTNAQKAQLQAIYAEREKELGGTGKYCAAVFTGIKKDEQAKDLISVRAYNNDVYNYEDVPAFAQRDNNGKPKNIIANYESIMFFEPRYKNVKYNLLANYAEVHDVNDSKGTVKIRRWDDTDEAESKKFIEEKYGIFSEQKHAAALRILFRARAYNPVLDYFSNLQWDGVERCEHFLTEWAKADDTPYVRECSRLIFAGGIWRIMQPGCKMDDVIILIGKQGGGKSSLVRFLAINDNYFGEIKSIEGKEAIEQLDGKWVCEIPEMAAFTRAKEVEAIKAFITRQKDNYRKPFDRNVDDRPRRCILIGTTNLPAPLMDATGSRRFYPVQTHCDGYDLFKHEDECREYIIKCWAEALDKYKRGVMPNFAREDLVHEYREAQANATQDDWRIGAIQAYLDDKEIGDFVCIKELSDNVISPDKDHPQNPSPKDSKDISIIMSKMKGWEKVNYPKHTAKYGNQRGWKKEAESTEQYETAKEGRDLPF